MLASVVVTRGEKLIAPRVSFLRRSNLALSSLSVWKQMTGPGKKLFFFFGGGGSYPLVGSSSHSTWTTGCAEAGVEGGQCAEAGAEAGAEGRQQLERQEALLEVTSSALSRIIFLAQTCPSPAAPHLWGSHAVGSGACFLSQYNPRRRKEIPFSSGEHFTPL